MRVATAAWRAALGMGSCTAALPVPGVALAGEPPAAHDPSLRIQCPEPRRVLEGYDGAPERGVSPREQVLRWMPWASPYTQVHMRGRLEVRAAPDGRVTTVVVRGEQAEPIATWRFVRAPGGWALRSSAQCWGEREPRTATLPDSIIRCPGYRSGGIYDYGSDPWAPVAPAKVDHSSPEQVIARGREFLGPYADSHVAGPAETTYRWEGTWATVVYRDAAGTPIAAFTMQRTTAGWRVQYDAECDGAGPDA